ncbi:BnaC05g44240D [Brassica napus]|uniref:BnaC05g44240D protein n=1 Tax=Brassica napus TaxID=3708 RepID=A0A078GSC4_BRANA|nr:BnaC05g44240D [Brassica napus]
MKDVVIDDDVGNADSIMDSDDGRRTFMVNAVTNHHTPTMFQETDVPVLSLDDDDDDLKIDEDYKLHLDHLSDDNSLVPPSEDDSKESETRRLRFNMVTNDANRSKRKIAELEAARDVPLASNMSEEAQEAIQRDNKARKMSETLWDVPLVRAQEVIQRGNKARRFLESKVDDTLRDVPLVRTKEVKALPVKRVHRVTEPSMTQSNKRVCVGTRKKSVEEVVDKDYMSYLTWLVDSFEHPTTVVPEKDLSAKVKVEIDSWCSDDDDDDIIEVSDTPFTDGESTPFVVSKNKEVIDLEKDDSTDDESGSSSAFRRELIDVLEKPYDAGELLLLSSQASMKKPVSRCRELRKGRESSYETSELGLSYLEKVCDFDREYKLADGDDKARLELLRGFFFYLENISLPGAFKPWLPENMKKLGRRKQCLQP